MSLEEEFNKAVGEWIKYCKKPEVRYSSIRVPVVISCDAYRKIVTMGTPILPLIRKLYDKDSSQDSALGKIKLFGLISTVKEIVGNDFQIPVEGIKNVEIEQYTKNWLDENMHKYMHEYLKDAE